MRARPTSVRAGSKARAVYDFAHVAWRVGAITSWYYGKRSPSDPTVVWRVDETEYHRDDHEGVLGAIAAAYAHACIARAWFGSSWCGYRALVVEYLDGA